MVELVRGCGHKCLLAKTDIQEAIRLIPIRPKITQSSVSCGRICSNTIWAFRWVTYLLDDFIVMSPANDFIVMSPANDFIVMSPANDFIVMSHANELTCLDSLLALSLSQDISIPLN